MRILVVDDEPEILISLSKWLSHNGHNSFKTSTPQRVLDFVQAGEFDAVLLDPLLPGCGGLDLISQIHDRKPKLPIIVMSFEEARIPAAQKEIFGYLTKPIDFDKLEELLRRIRL